MRELEIFHPFGTEGISILAITEAGCLPHVIVPFHLCEILDTLTSLIFTMRYPVMARNLRESRLPGRYQEYWVEISLS